MAMRRLKKPLPGRARKGLSLIEVAAGLTVAAIGAAGFAVWQVDAARATKANAAGAMMRTVTDAAKYYVLANRTQINSATTENGPPIEIVVAKTTAAGTPPEGSIQATGFLPTSWVDRNPYGHNHRVFIRRLPGGHFEMLVFQSGGQNVERQSELVRMANAIGQGAGFVPFRNIPGANTTHVTSANGIWSHPRTTWTVSGVQPQPGRAAAFVTFVNN